MINDNSCDELQTDYDMYDYNEQDEDDESFDIEMELKPHPEVADVEGLAKLYYEFCGEKLPEPYKDYANKDFISETWGSLTCSVIKTLDDIGWKSMSSQDKRAFFEVIAAYAKFDEQHYKKEYYHIVYAILYQIVWAACKKLRSDKARANLDDIISETLIGVASDISQLSRYDPTYSPITYLDRLVMTQISQAYYNNTEAQKRTTIIRRDAEAIKNTLKRSNNCNEHITNSTGFHQIYMETKRSQNPPAHTEIDVFLHAVTNKTLGYNENSLGTINTELESLDTTLEENVECNSDKDNEVLQGIKKALERRYHNSAPKYLDAFLWYIEGTEIDNTQFSKKNKTDEKYQMAMEVRKLLSNNHKLKKIGRRNGHIVGGDTELSMNDNSISEDILQRIINSDIDTDNEEPT